MEAEVGLHNLNYYYHYHHRSCLLSPDLIRVTWTYVFPSHYD
jgi:hypothetical protein